ncbi:MAG: chemotaxis protein CheX [Desulfobacterales bacterium]
MDPFEDIFPDILEKGTEEAGALIGDTLELQTPENSTGTAAEVFSPPKKSFALAQFKPKGTDGPPVYMVFGLDAAVELAGRLIMLPADEIAAEAKKAKLEGELLDAFSEITNIISGVLNSLCQEAFPKKKLYFVMGGVEVYPGKAKNLPLPEGSLSSYSGDLVLKDERRGRIQFFFPHALMAEFEDSADETTAEDQNQQKDASTQLQESTPPSHAGDPAAVDELLKDGLGLAKEEMGALLGEAVEFADPQTGFKTREQLLSETRGKQVITRIAASGDAEGEVFLLLPVKDAIHFAGLLLMMPAESIAQEVKQAKFEGEVADAFGEIANILVGSYSNQFSSGAPVRLKLKKQRVETLVPAKGDAESGGPFEDRGYYVLSAGIRLGEKSYGPLELVFPADMLGLRAEPDKARPRDSVSISASPSESAGSESQKPVRGQKTDTAAELDKAGENGRLITVIGADQKHLKLVEQCARDRGAELSGLPPDADFREAFSGGDPDCVFLFINRVNDQGLSRAIKVRGAMKDKKPLIVAGPEWTRSRVLKARKYGATDILVTPADSDMIMEKCSKYI